MHTVVEVGGWEHECCGPSYERNTIVELTCFALPDEGGTATRYVESHHDLASEHHTTLIRGRVADVRVRHPDGSTEQIERLPSGAALRGFDEQDDGHLHQPTTDLPVLNDAGEFLITVVS